MLYSESTEYSEGIAYRGRSVGGRKGKSYRKEGYPESADELQSLMDNLLFYSLLFADEGIYFKNVVNQPVGHKGKQVSDGLFLILYFGDFIQV